MQYLIDDVDILSQYGVFIVDGSFERLFSYPPLKEPEFNDWAEEDGIEVDLSSPKLSAREIDVNFGVCGNGNVQAFIEMLVSQNKHTLSFPELGCEFELRLKGSKEYTGINNTFSTILLAFSEDTPLNGFTYQSPIPGANSGQQYQIDGKDLSDYGIIMLSWSDLEIKKYPSFKQGLVIDSKVIQGLISDAGTLRITSKDVRVSLLMRVSEKMNFIRNFHGFLFDLIRPGERELYVGKTGKKYLFYYKKSEVVKLSVSDDVWCLFDVDLCFTGNSSQE